jgi:hypothetical protein
MGRETIKDLGRNETLNTVIALGLGIKYSNLEKK